MSKALKEAIQANDPDAARKALLSVKDVNRKLPGARAPLAYACECGADQVLEPLFEAGAIAEKRNTFIDDKPFAIAASKRKFSVVKRFLELGKVPKETLEKVIEHACYEGQPELLEFLLKETKPPITIDLYRLAAARSTAPQIFKVILANGGDPMSRHDRHRETGMTVLHEIVTNGKAALIKILAEAGADVNARDDFGRTPLMMLAHNLELIGFINQRARVTGDLLEKGEVQLISGEAPAVVDAAEAIRTLNNLGADGKLVDRFGNDAIDHCVFSFHGSQENPPEEYLALLRQSGAKGSGSTLDLFRALQRKNVRAVEESIENGADLNRVSPPPDGFTPLEAAASMGGPEGAELVHVLLKAGADPNRAGHGKTPLMRAVCWGTLDSVKELIAAGADVHAIHQSGDYLENAYTNADNKEDARAYLKSLGASSPRYKDARKFEAGVASWNDFGELLVKGAVDNVAEGLAKLIGGKVQMNAYGQSFEPGLRSFVVIRPKGMEWTNVFQVAPARKRFEDVKKLRQFAAEVAGVCQSPALSIEYSDTSDAASIARIDANGKVIVDDGWDPDSLKEFVDAMGNEVPAWAKKRLKQSAEDDLSSTQRLVELAEREKFVVAAFNFYAAAGKALEIDVRGYGADAFDDVAFVSV